MCSSETERVLEQDADGDMQGGSKDIVGVRI